MAWHNVFWNLVSEYERLRLAIETREPFRATDQELAVHIAMRYRQKLYAECVQKIQTRFLERLADRTHESSDHTDS